MSSFMGNGGGTYNYALLEPLLKYYIKTFQENHPAREIKKIIRVNGRQIDATDKSEDKGEEK
jgi:hypothetical protein